MIALRPRPRGAKTLRRPGTPCGRQVDSLVVWRQAGATMRDSHRGLHHRSRILQSSNRAVERTCGNRQPGNAVRDKEHIPGPSRSPSQSKVSRDRPRHRCQGSLQPKIWPGCRYCWRHRRRSGTGLSTRPCRRPAGFARPEFRNRPARLGAYSAAAAQRLLECLPGILWP